MIAIIIFIMGNVTDMPLVWYLKVSRTCDIASLTGKVADVPFA